MTACARGENPKAASSNAARNNGAVRFSSINGFMWFFLPFPRAVLDLWNRGSGKGEEPGGARFPPDSDPFDGEF